MSKSLQPPHYRQCVKCRIKTRNLLFSIFIQSTGWFERRRKKTNILPPNSSLRLQARFTGRTQIASSQAQQATNLLPESGKENTHKQQSSFLIEILDIKTLQITANIWRYLVGPGDYNPPHSPLTHVRLTGWGRPLRWCFVLSGAPRTFRSVMISGRGFLSRSFPV